MCPQATAFHFISLFCQLLVTCTMVTDLILLDSKSLKCSKCYEQAHNNIQVMISRSSEQLWPKSCSVGTPAAEHTSTRLHAIYEVLSLQMKLLHSNSHLHGELDRPRQGLLLLKTSPELLSPVTNPSIASLSTCGGNLAPQASWKN